VSKERNNSAPEESKSEPPKYIVSYSALMTILLAFFIILNTLAVSREYGFKGAGLGIFRMSFQSLGLPGILTGARGPVRLQTTGGKYAPAVEPADEAESKRHEGRLIYPDRRDLKQTLISVLKTRNRVTLPLNTRYAEKLNRKSRKELDALARLLRQSDCEILVCATIPKTGKQSPHSWYDASMWALRVGKYLCHNGHVAANRVTAIGYAALPEQERAADGRGNEPTISLILRPPRKPLRASPPEERPLHRLHFRRNLTPVTGNSPMVEE